MPSPRRLPPGAVGLASVVLLLAAAIVSLGEHGVVRILAGVVVVLSAVQLGVALAGYRRGA